MRHQSLSPTYRRRYSYHCSPRRLGVKIIVTKNPSAAILSDTESTKKMITKMNDDDSLSQTMLKPCYWLRNWTVQYTQENKMASRTSKIGISKPDVEKWTTDMYRILVLPVDKKRACPQCPWCSDKVNTTFQVSSSASSVTSKVLLTGHPVRKSVSSINFVLTARSVKYLSHTRATRSHHAIVKTLPRTSKQAVKLESRLSGTRKSLEKCNVWDLLQSSKVGC